MNSVHKEKRGKIYYKDDLTKFCGFFFVTFKFITSVVHINKIGFIHPCRQSGVACIFLVPKWQLSTGVREEFYACQRILVVLLPSLALGLAQEMQIQWYKGWQSFLHKSLKKRNRPEINEDKAEHVEVHGWAHVAADSSALKTNNMTC